MQPQTPRGSAGSLEGGGSTGGGIGASPNCFTNNLPSKRDRSSRSLSHLGIFLSGEVTGTFDPGLLHQGVRRQGSRFQTVKSASLPTSSEPVGDQSPIVGRVQRDELQASWGSMPPYFTALAASPCIRRASSLESELNELHPHLMHDPSVPRNRIHHFHFVGPPVGEAAAPAPCSAMASATLYPSRMCCRCQCGSLFFAQPQQRQDFILAIGVAVHDAIASRISTSVCNSRSKRGGISKHAHLHPSHPNAHAWTGRTPPGQSDLA